MSEETTYPIEIYKGLIILERVHGINSTANLAEKAFDYLINTEIVFGGYALRIGFCSEKEINGRIFKKVNGHSEYAGYLSESGHFNNPKEAVEKVLFDLVLRSFS